MIQPKTNQHAVFFIPQVDQIKGESNVFYSQVLVILSLSVSTSFHIYFHRSAIMLSWCLV